MQQDQRIGLALGVLLIGACAAFFFRNEPRTSVDLPRLKNAQGLDERIAERSVRPYLKGIEAIEASDRNRGEGEFIRSRNSWNPFRSHARKSVDANEPNPATLREKGNAASDEILEVPPIAVSAAPGSPASDTHNPNMTTTDSPNGEIPAVTDSLSGDRTYVVQKGETLCSIAARTLGNSSRYHDLFEANKDQLNDPNDLKQGMTLRIPQSGGESLQGAASTFGSTVILPEPLEAEPPLTNSGSSADTGSIALPPMLPSPGGDERFGPLDDSATPRKFVPARRSPAPERAFEPQSQVNPQHQKSVRRLSQRYSDLQPTTIAR